MKALQSARPNFLILTPICLSLGLIPAWQTLEQPSLLQVILVLIAGVSAHISVNAFNEYFDFKSGLDLNTKRTPFSGGSGTLPDNPHLLGSVFVLAITSFVVTASIGLYFVWLRGLPMLLLGLTGLIIILLYTRYINRSVWLCLVSPGLSFGLLMVNGAYFALTGHFSESVLIYSLIPFFLVNNLLLLNQFPDLEADRKAGRNHLIIRYGKKAGVLVYTLNAVLAITALPIAAFFSLVPINTLWALVAGLILIPILHNMNQYYLDNEKLQKGMGMNVLLTLIFPAILALSLLLNL